MSTKFFTNSTGNTLFDKFKGIAADMINWHSCKYPWLIFVV